MPRLAFVSMLFIGTVASAQGVPGSTALGPGPTSSATPRFFYGTGETPTMRRDRAALGRPHRCEEVSRLYAKRGAQSASSRAYADCIRGEVRESDRPI